MQEQIQAQVRLTATPTDASIGVTAPVGRSHELDFLRGLAIVGVLAIHVSQAFPSGLRIVDFVFSSGWVGVNVFYFVSALTMCLMWTQREGESNPTRKFYIRRFLRIAPLFWLAIPLYLALNGTGPSYDAPNGIGSVQITLTALFLHGFWPDSINSVVPGDWSIAAEMTFYVVFPFVIASFGSRRHLYLALAISINLFNVCVFKPQAYAFFVAYYGSGHEAFVWNALHLSFVNQLPIFLAGCALFFALRNHIALVQLPDHQPDSRCLRVRMHPFCDWLAAAGSARAQFLFDVSLALRGHPRPAPAVAAGRRAGLAPDRCRAHGADQLPGLDRDLSPDRTASPGAREAPDLRGTRLRPARVRAGVAGRVTAGRVRRGDGFPDSPFLGGPDLPGASAAHQDIPELPGIGRVDVLRE
jgi:hypothetical protein